MIKGNVLTARFACALPGSSAALLNRPRVAVLLDLLSSSIENAWRMRSMRPENIFIGTRVLFIHFHAKKD